MSIKDPIRQVKEAIGKNKEQDYRLRLGEHPNELRASAPQMADILESSVVTGTRQQYEKKDRKAVEAAAEFTRVFNRANTLVLITTILTALVLTVGILSPALEKLSKGLETVILMVLTIGSVATGAFASKDLYMVRQGKLLEEWMTARAAAENKRLEYFMEVMKADIPQPENGLPINLLKLEYFCRFQLETQLAYFDRRGEDKRLESNKNLKQSGLAVAGAAVVTGSAAISTMADAKFAAIASLGAVFAAVSSYIALKEQIYQNQQISERFAATFDSLEDIYKRMDSTREAVLQSGREPLLRFVESVHEILLAEHKQWLGEKEQRSQSLVKLDELLAKASAKKETKQQGEEAENQPQQQQGNAQLEQEVNAGAELQAPVQEQPEEVLPVQNQQAEAQEEQNDMAENAEDATRELSDEAQPATGEDLQPEVVAEEKAAAVLGVKKDAGLFQ